MKYIVLIILLLSSNLADAQNNKFDNLYEFTYSELKNKFYDYYDYNKTSDAKQIATYYLQKAKKEKNTLEIAEGYILVHFYEEYPTALKYLDSLTIITKNIKGNLYPARTYLTKGNLYYKQDNLKAALDNYILGLKYAKEQHDEKQTAYANMNIAYINSYIGKNTEAAKTFRYYLYNGNKITDDYQHNQMRIALISCYLEINKLDSANILIKEGQKAIFTGKNKYDPDLYSYLAGTYDLKLKAYDTAIIKLSNAYTYFANNNENINANYALYNLGKAYQGIKNEEKVIESYIKLDSNVQKYNITFPDLREVYTYLIDYYKANNNQQKQLYYIDRFLIVDKKLDEQIQYLSTELPKKYDTPNLLQEKEDIIEKLEIRKKVLYISVGVLLLILLFIIYLYYKSKKTEKEQRKIAQDLISLVEKRNIEEGNTDEKKEANDIEIIHLAIPEQSEQNDKTSKVISEEVTQFILQELRIFESRELFLNKGVTLASLAKNIKTNTAYLSEIINTHKGKNFASYLNDLRIDFALNRLVKDKKFRSYKLSVIAEELGYNNEQAFSLAFKKKTGTTLSMYIKEIDNLNDSQNNHN
ncbi:helix-turn-helix domain-containing protein [Chryseobacterium jejuense]|uniref:helix-turn-helix domain-containing protein n=1 Tax=Chryseobacterium jejuense TaxID=445960 RepID=UPI001AE10F90|nr:AraC family transcriptional regulator [Chryseobacterium jejuense]MBP2618736.1 AraC-like DNA-binding protein [Chryseobacterium jejuense]